MTRGVSIPRYMVARMDDHGGLFLVKDGLTADAANDLRCSLAARGHKQDYVVVSYAEGDRDATLVRLGITA